MAPPTSTLTLGFLGILFYRFFRLGLTAFGGPAMIAYIRDMAVQKEKWLDQESFKQGVAICQTIPGATAMQVAAYVGLRSGGAWGAIAAYVGFGLPAFVLMVLLSALYGQSHDLATVVSIFAGLQVIVVAMVAHATVHFGRSTLRDWRDWGLGLVVAGFLLIGGNPLVAILAAALLGLLLFQQTIQPGSNSRSPGFRWCPALSSRLAAQPGTGFGNLPVLLPGSAAL